MKKKRRWMMRHEKKSYKVYWSRPSWIINDLKMFILHIIHQPPLFFLCSYVLAHSDLVSKYQLTHIKRSTKYEQLKSASIIMNSSGNFCPGGAMHTNAFLDILEHWEVVHMIQDTLWDILKNLASFRPADTPRLCGWAKNCRPRTFFLKFLDVAMFLL